MPSAGHPARVSNEEATALRQLVGVEDHVRFLEQLVDSFPWTAQSRDSLNSSIRHIRQKDKDPRLYLGIIGEFSSGKSTLINALLRDELLRADILQGTTAAITVLRYHPHLHARVTFQSGGREDIFADDRQRFLERVQQATAEEEVARQVAHVEVLHPAENLHQGLVIVDTPGANVKNSRHVMVTAAAIRNLCDTAVVLIPAQAAVSQTLLDLLREKLADVLHRCVFLVSKMDLIRRPAERLRLLQNIRTRLSQELGLDSPAVFSAAPQVVVDSLASLAVAVTGSRLSDEDRRMFLDQFAATEEALWRLLRRQKVLVHVERLILVISRLLSKLRRSLQDAASGYRRRHDVLRRNALPDPAAFFAQEKRHRSRAVRDRIAALRHDVAQEVRKSAAGCRKEIKSVVQSCKTEQELQSVTEQRISRVLGHTQSSLQAVVNSQLETVTGAAEQEMHAFHEVFSNVYCSLASLLPGVEAARPVQQALAFPNESQLQRSIDTLARGIQDELAAGRVNQEAGWGMAAVGAVVVGIAIPGAGLPIGYALGKVLGDFFKPSLDEMKARYLKELLPRVEDHFNACEQNAVDVVRKAGEAGELRLERWVDQNARDYDELIRQVVARDQDELDRLSELERKTAGNLAELERRHQHLVGLQQQLRSRTQACSE